MRLAGLGGRGVRRSHVPHELWVSSFAESPRWRIRTAVCCRWCSGTCLAGTTRPLYALAPRRRWRVTCTGLGADTAALLRAVCSQGVKKPYNPIIGETFACAWKHKDSVSQYYAEQVSHRPPVSAMYFENRKANLVINAQVWTKSKFKAPQTAVSILAGGADVHVLNHDEVVRR